MLPRIAQKRDSSTSELFNCMKTYLNFKGRIQPFIGLSSVIECVKAGTRKTQIFYLCEVCICRHNKADMRRHIMGSCHIYNYIKTCHPHFISEWEDDTIPLDARELMEIAKKIEKKEGTGYIQVLDFEEDLYQALERQSVKSAITLINSLRWHLTQSEPDGDCDQPENAARQQRVVLLSKCPRGQPEECTDDGLNFFDTNALYQASAENNSPLTQQTVYASFKQNHFPQSHSESPKIWMLPELSENSNFLDRYKGSKPLIGLENVVECRSEDGHTYCFLCHRCRVKSNKYDIIDHLTCSSHLFNILMETHPEQVARLSADINDNYKILQSLAKEVENSEGRRAIKVLKVPDTLCNLMTGRSYHWWLGVTQNYAEGFPENQEPVYSNWIKKKKKKKKRKSKSKVSDTTFKVTLPLVQGSLLVRRMSFSGDDQLVSPAHAGVHASPELEDFQLDCDANSGGFNYSENYSMDANSQLKPNDYNESTDQNIGQKVDGFFSDTGCINQTEGREITFYEGRHAETQDLSGAYEVGHSAAQEKQTDDTSHKHVWPSPYIYQYGGGYTNHWYSSSHYNDVGSTNMTRMSSQAAQHQHFQNQDMVQDPQSQFTANMGHQFMSGGLPPNYVVGMNTHPQFGHDGHPSAYCSSIRPTQAPFSHMTQTQFHTYEYVPLYFGHTQAHSMAYQGVTYDPNCNTHYGITPQFQK